MMGFGLEAYNLARLNLILGLDWVNPRLKRWHKIISLDETSFVEFSCDGVNNAVPHGIDTDVMFALTTAYELQGRPDDQVIILSMTEICYLAGIKPSDHVYQSVQESIQRLQGVRYGARSCQSVPSSSKLKWRSLDFVAISYVLATGESENLSTRGQYTADTEIHIGLGHVVASIIKNSRTRKVNLNFCSKIDQTLGRSLYRTLEEIRAGGELILSLEELCEHLGICDYRDETSEAGHLHIKLPHNKLLKQSLEKIHNDLIKFGYLVNVEYIDENGHHSIRYIFSDVSEGCGSVDLGIIGLMTSRGIGLERANELAVLYSVEQIEVAAQCFDRRLAAGFQPRVRGAVMADMLMNPEKYPQGDVSRSLPVTLLLQEAAEGAAEPEVQAASRHHVPGRSGVNGDGSGSGAPRAVDPQGSGLAGACSGGAGVRAPVGCSGADKGRRAARPLNATSTAGKVKP